VQSAIRISNFLTPYELERMRALQEEEREVQFVTLSAEKFAGKEPIAEADIEKAYQENLSRYMNPEYVRLAYAELRVDQLAAQVTVTDDEVSEAYEKSKDRYETPEKRRVRQILIAVEGNNDDEARKEAEKVLADAKAGKDFAALAKQHSDDTGSAQQGGDIGFIERSYFEGAFAGAVFSMSPGEIRGPVKTEYGYHVIKLEEIQPGSTRTLEQARDEIRAELQRERAADRLSEVQQALEARIEAPGADLDGIAKEFGMQVGQVERFERGSGGAPLGNSDDLQEAVFSADVIDERRIAGPVPLGEDRLVLVKALEHQKAEPKPLAEVRDDVIATLRKQRGTEAAVKAAEAARAELEAGTPFATVAKKLGVELEPARYIGREDPSVPAQVRDLAFRSPKPKSGPIFRTATLDSGGAALVAITGVRTENSLPNAQLQVARAQAAMARGGAGDFVAYLEEVRRNADVEKNPRAFE
jgi:peptidyl-prolyl cis-trans isomerase D